MSEPFDLELFLAGKRLWDEGEPWETVPMDGSGQRIAFANGEARWWPLPLGKDAVNALQYFIGDYLPIMPPMDERDALAAEILRLRECEQQLKRLGYALGMVAPCGTAPREALYRLWKACEAGEPAAPYSSALNEMLQPHWGEWEPKCGTDLISQVHPRDAERLAELAVLCNDSNSEGLSP